MRPFLITLLLAFCLAEVATRAEVYDHLWKLSAGAGVRLGILRDGEHVIVEVASVDRTEFYR